MPTLDTYTLFLVILSGFAVVWNFRKFSGSTKNISDFEYLMFSALWGVFVAGGYAWVFKARPEALAVLNNPYSAGILLFIVGWGVGGVAAWIVRWWKKRKLS